MFARSAANEREAVFQDDAGVRMRRLRGRFGPACGSTSGANRLKHNSVPIKIEEVLLAAFIYFAPTPQKAVLERIAASLELCGLLVIGSHEHLPGSMARWRHFRDNRTILEEAGK